jgi:hypothetical protein
MVDRALAGNWRVETRFVQIDLMECFTRLPSACEVTLECKTTIAECYLQK